MSKHLNEFDEFTDWLFDEFIPMLKDSIVIGLTYAIVVLLTPLWIGPFVIWYNFVRNDKNET